MIKEIFGNNLKFYRMKNNMSQEELADATGIDRPQISKIEQGKINVTLETVDRLAKALKISSIDLLKEIPTLHPFVKWAGGKSQLLEKLRSYIPESFNNYFEPFIGGGSFFLSLSPSKATINDYNEELILAYKCIQDDEKFEKLKAELEKHERNHSEEYYYKIREMDRDPNFNNLDDFIRAARMIYLNKSCFNGLYRVNRNGYFNVPSGKKRKVNTYDRKNFAELHNYLNEYFITILNCDFEEATKDAKKGDLVYFDPPYDNFEDKETFTSYSKDNFGKEEQIRLCELYKKLSKKGVYCILSNHNTSFIQDLYKDFNIHVVNAKRMINSDPKGRGGVEEVIITNY